MGRLAPDLSAHRASRARSRLRLRSFPGYDMGIPEQVRAELFLQEFREFERNHNLPNLIVMLLPIDHTNGTSPGFPTPRAMVADNDLAVGRIVDAVTHSSYWPATAIFVTEDDSQNGVDHVDGHRSEALMISPYTRRRSVDSTLYSTANMVRTIERILGLPPMNQFDAAAVKHDECLREQARHRSIHVLPNQIPLDEMNAPVASLHGLQEELAVASLKMDFSEPDSGARRCAESSHLAFGKGVRHTLSAHSDTVVLASSSQTGRDARRVRHFLR